MCCIDDTPKYHILTYYDENRIAISLPLQYQYFDTATCLVDIAKVYADLKMSIYYLHLTSHP
jgi:hypothetical protein